MRAQRLEGAMKRAVAVLPVALLLAVCARQVFLVQTRGLSPWKGGGFGLFSTIDKGQNREFSCIGQDTRGRLCRIHLTFAGELDDEGFDRAFRKRLLNYPSPARLRELGGKLLLAEYVPAPSPHQLLQGLPPDHRGRLRFAAAAEEPTLILRLLGQSGWRVPEEKRVRIRALRLSVWRLRFDPETQRMEWESVGETVELGTWS